jgi:hypothetical protein
MGRHAETRERKGEEWRIVTKWARGRIYWGGVRNARGYSLLWPWGPSAITAGSGNPRGSAPFDQYENHRDHTTTPLSITCSQWAAGADHRTSMRITDTVWLRYRSHATLWPLYESKGVDNTELTSQPMTRIRISYSSSRWMYPETACNASKEARMPNKTGSL